MPKKVDKKPKLTRKQKQLAAARSNGVDNEDGSSKSGHVKVERLETPVKSDLDKNEYRVIKLPNGLTALLIAHGGGESADQNDLDCDDVEADEGPNLLGMEETKDKEPFTSSCCLCINVGSFSEHARMAGESHIVADVVRSGSKKYPNEKAYRESSDDGFRMLISSNRCETTALTFLSSTAALSRNLDHFVESFVCPLMKRSEIIATKEEIESEYEGGCHCSQYADRKQHLYSSLGDCGHPILKFGEHYLENLRQASEGNAYKEVMRFHKRHYSAHRMTVVLEADLPLDILEDYAKQYFSKIPSNRLPADDFTKFGYTDFYDMNDFPKIYTMKPREFSPQVKSLEVTWPMPPLGKHYRTKPHHYIQFLMNHDGEGSLTRYLEKMKLCTSVTCRVGGEDYEENSIWSLFTLSLALTEDGHANIVTILDAVYSYVNMLRREGPQERIYEEIRKKEEAKFRFEKVSCNTENICENMHLYRPSEFLTGSVLFFDYDPTSIQDCLDLLKPDKANVIIYDPNFKEEEYVVENDDYPDDLSYSGSFYLETIYHTSIAIKDGWIRNWQNIQPFPAFKLPEPNPFATD